MANTLISVGRLAVAIRAATDENNVEAEIFSQIDRLHRWACATVEREAEDAPDVFKEEAITLLAGYVFDRPSSREGSGYSNAWINSGASSVLKPYLDIASGIIGDDQDAPFGGAAVNEDEVRRIATEILNEVLLGVAAMGPRTNYVVLTDSDVPPSAAQFLGGVVGDQDGINIAAQMASKFFHFADPVPNLYYMEKRFEFNMRTRFVRSAATIDLDGVDCYIYSSDVALNQILTGGPWRLAPAPNVIVVA